jgi:serpin B
VEVSEEGTVATAASAVVTGYVGGVFHTPSVIPVFRADHPFMFVILHNVSGSILFMGRVMNPLEGA